MQTGPIGIIAYNREPLPFTTSVLIAPIKRAVSVCCVQNLWTCSLCGIVTQLPPNRSSVTFCNFVDAC